MGPFLMPAGEAKRPTTRGESEIKVRHGSCVRMGDQAKGRTLSESPGAVG